MRVSYPVTPEGGRRASSPNNPPSQRPRSIRSGAANRVSGRTAAAASPVASARTARPGTTGATGRADAADET